MYQSAGTAAPSGADRRIARSTRRGLTLPQATDAIMNGRYITTRGARRQTLHVVAVERASARLERSILGAVVRPLPARPPRQMVNVAERVGGDSTRGLDEAHLDGGAVRERAAIRCAVLK